MNLVIILTVMVGLIMLSVVLLVFKKETPLTPQTAMGPIEQGPVPDTQSASKDTSTPQFPLDVAASASVPASVMQWSDLAQQWASEYSILDPEEILAIVWNESTGDPQASNPHDPSWGLMGVTANIARSFGGFMAMDVSWHTDPNGNVKAGAGYLAYLKNRFSDSPDWSDAYNEGETHFANGQILTPGYSQAFRSHVAAIRAQEARNG